MADPHDPGFYTDLLEAALGGDEEAYACFCLEALPLLQFYLAGLCQVFGLSQDLVGDFCNETVVKVLKYARNQKQRRTPSRSEPISSAKAWIKTVARRVVLDYLRKQRRHKERPLGDLDAVSPANAEALVDLLDLLDTLPPREGEVTRCLYIERLTVAETAEKLGISQEATRKAHVRAIHRLKKQL